MLNFWNSAPVLQKCSKIENFNSIQLFITNPLVTHGTFYIGNEHTHSMIMHKNTNSIALQFIL